jgi:peptidoglycan-associated lipoprotein
MRKLSMFVLIVLAFSLAMAGGCSKKVSSTPADTSAASSSPDAGGLSSAQLEAQRLAELQRQAIDKIGADRIYFAFDRSELSDQSRQVLAEKAELLKTHSALSLLIEGHCDERGTNEYNMALGERRARAAYEYLVLMGIASDRLTIISYGEEYPAVPGSNEEAWAKNRRDEFKASVSQ